MEQISERPCKVCDGDGWVCENHPDTGWTGGDGCCGGAGQPCGACSLEMAAAGYVARAVADALRTANNCSDSELHLALVRIANHFDMDGYGSEAWKQLALEMAGIARAAIAKATGQ